MTAVASGSNRAIFICRKWEDVDHEFEDSIAGALTSPVGGGGDAEGDPLGLRSVLRSVFLSQFASTAGN
jgi:hypothetical protein